MNFSPSLRREYLDLLSSCQIAPGSRVAALALATKIGVRRPKYTPVAVATGVPWFFIALVHQMECGARFDCHLHNGDSLRTRTVHVPAGRPLTGSAPFTWQESAVDALRYQGFDKVKGWDASDVLFRLEAYNGFAYRRMGRNSPYLWSKSNHEVPGKFTSDRHFDPNARSSQIGAGTLLHALRFLKIVSLPLR